MESKNKNKKINKNTNYFLHLIIDLQLPDYPFCFKFHQYFFKSLKQVQIFIFHFLQKFLHCFLITELAFFVVLYNLILIFIFSQSLSYFLQLLIMNKYFLKN